MKNPVLALGAGAAALALVASSKKKKGGSKGVPAALKPYNNDRITVSPDGTKIYVGLEWPYKFLIPELNNFVDTPFGMIDDAFLTADVIVKTQFQSPDGKKLSWDDIPDTAQKKDFEDSIRKVTKAYRKAREGGLSEVMLGHYRKIMAQYKCELPESPDYLPPSCVLSIALGNI